MKPAAWVSALRRPVSSRIPARWSTALMVVLFIGLGLLWIEVRTTPSSSTTRSNANLGNLVQNLPPGYVISRPGETTTTTTTNVPAPTTTVGPPSTTVAPPTTVPAAGRPTTTSTTRSFRSPSPTNGSTTSSTPTSTSVPGG